MNESLQSMRFEELASKFIIKGVTDAEFAPQKDVTRAEFLTLIIRAMGVQKSADGQPQFNDVQSGAWYAESLAIALQLGVVKGFNDGSFRPVQSITRQEMATMLLNVLQALQPDATLNNNPNVEHFTDHHEVAAWAQEAVSLASQMGWIQGYPNGQFGPQQAATRAEAVQMLARIVPYLHVR